MKKLFILFILISSNLYSTQTNITIEVDILEELSLSVVRDIEFPAFESGVYR